MNSTRPTSTDRACPRLALSSVLALAVAFGAAGCGSSSSSGGADLLPPGEFGTKPEDGSLYISDPKLEPGGSRLGLVEVVWGRLVDVHDLDVAGETEGLPLLRDVVVRPDLATDGVDYRLERDTLTQVERLVVLRDADGPGAEDFRELVRAAASELPLVEPKQDDGTGVAPFSVIPCNAAVLLCFDDLIDARAAVSAGLEELIHVRTGYRPIQPFTARLRFDTTFGGVTEGAFHPSRVLVDPAVSDVDALADGAPPANAFGFPASLVGVEDANLSLRLPTRVDVASGQFAVLTNLRGRALAVEGNGPVDRDDPTQPLVRAARSGNDQEPFGGFLPDDVAPRLIGDWRTVVDAARADPDGEPTHLRVDVTFTTACRRAPARGDVLVTGAGLLQVREDAAAPDAAGRVVDLRVAARTVPDARGALGAADYWTPFDAGLGVDAGCWARFQPEPSGGPSEGVAPDARVVLRFSEPVDPRPLRALDGPVLVQGVDAPSATTLAPRIARVDGGMRQLELLPLVALPHVAGASEEWRLVVGAADRAVADLAGNPLAAAPDAVAFTLDPAADTSETGGIVLRMRGADEYGADGAGDGANDLRGQFSYDLERGVARPRPVNRQSWAVDQTQLLPSLMLPLPVSVPEPLMPLGSRLQTLWRYADVGWRVDDESLYDLDVEGLSWAPFGGGIVADFYEGFELRLGHGSRLPDETFSMGLLFYPNSGLLSAPSAFDENLVQGRDGLSEIVHPSAAGYLVDPTTTYAASSGTRMVPFPLNRGAGEQRLFTWRDTTVTSEGGANGSGIPMQVETDLGLYPNLAPGELAPAGEVPSIGLPLLMEFRTQPDTSALGLNGFQVAIARATQLFPTWRVHSSGGYDVSGSPVSRNPDLEDVPRGGFDPTSTPPGMPTRPNDPALYFGELQTVVRYSRAHSVWFDAGAADVEWGPPLVFPPDTEQPGDARIRLEFRGATGFVATDGAEADADRLDAYGDVDTGQVQYLDTDPSWRSSILQLDGARYVQVRITFENDVEANVSPALDALVLTHAR